MVEDIEPGQIARRDAIPALSLEQFIATPKGLIVKGDVPFEAWAAYGQALQLVQEAVHWILGDWLQYGEERYGEKYAQALDATSFSYGTLRNDRWVASRIEPARRRDDLSWSHHQEVSSLEPEQQDFYLEEAERQGWSKRELREAIRKERSDGVCETCAYFVVVKPIEEEACAVDLKELHEVYLFGREPREGCDEWKAR